MWLHYAVYIEDIVVMTKLGKRMCNGYKYVDLDMIYWPLNTRIVRYFSESRRPFRMTLSHYSEFIMGAMASQITSLSIVYLTVYSGADQRIHQSSVSLAFVRGIHRDRRIPRTKIQQRRKCFHLMTSSCYPYRWHGSSITGENWK